MNVPEAVGVRAPTRRSRSFVHRLVGFGVWVAFGCAPFLGKVHVPGFSALLDMYPVEMRDWLIPLSGLLMGMLALVVEFAAGKGIAQQTLTRWFVRTVIVFGTSFIVLVAVYLFIVTRVEMATDAATPDRTSFAFVTGALEVPRIAPGSDCKCIEGQPADLCIQNTSLNPTNVRRCFGATRVAFSTLLLAALYLSLTGSFAAGVGLQMLAEGRTEEPP